MLGAGLALLAGCAGPAAAQQACMARDRLADLLAARYGETRRAAGLEASGRLVELFASAGGASWTLAVTTPGGASCVIAVGEHWQDAMVPTAPLSGIPAGAR